MTKFSSLYKKLNKEQKEAVDTIDGPVMIIAGPGTGKTTTLTMRIANILKKTDTDPGSILALTFTESGVKAMREQLIEIIGPTAYYVHIHTFHSFCSDIIKEFSEIFTIAEDATPLSDIERVQLFRELIQEINLDHLRPVNAPYLFLHDIVKAISDLKRENINPERYTELITEEEQTLGSIPEEELINPRTKKLYVKYAQQEKSIEKNKELLQIYIQYKKRIAEMNRYDFEDMINFVVEKLEKDENLKLTLQERYLYILVDEYQDTNAAQNEIVRLLTDHWEDSLPNIFVVGDDEQAIYRFQGASLENILYFKKLFKLAKVVTLTSNYRSSQHILDASRSLIDKNLLKLEDTQKNLKSTLHRRNIPIEVAQLTHGYIENQFIAISIKDLLKKGIDPDEIVILVRNNSDIDDIQDALSRNDIRHEIASGKNILQDGDINRLLLLFSVIQDIGQKPSEDIDLFTLLNYEFLDFNQLDILKLSRYASEKRMNLIDIIVDSDIFNETTIKNPQKFIDLINKLKAWQKLDANATFTKFFEQVIQKSGFLDWILSDKQNISRIGVINALFEEVKQLNRADHTLDLASFLENIELMKENNIKIEQQSLEGDVQAVKLLTAHKAKGLEFEYVFLAKCIDKRWGNQIRYNKIKLPEGIVRHVDIDKKEKNEDERRLFYVALTRAKKKITITHASEYNESGYKRTSVPSMFISEIDKKFRKETDVSNFREMIKLQQEQQLSLPVAEESEHAEHDFLNKLIGNFKMNITALNTYLKCHYKFKLNTVLRTPRSKPPYLSFGTAIHKALEMFSKEYKKVHALPSKQLLVDQFSKALQKEVLTKDERSQLLKRGKDVLSDYYDKNKNRLNEPIFSEYSFGFRNGYLGDIPLSGKIDKIEWIDQVKRQVKVVDYKTGKPKSRGEIEGKTKYSDGDLYRQLLFYKLLAGLDRNLNYNVDKGEFDFVETKGGRNAKCESYEYKIEEIEDLKNLIRTAMKQIRNLEFERTKEYRHCQQCDFRTHCWPDGIPNT